MRKGTYNKLIKGSGYIEPLKKIFDYGYEIDGEAFKNIIISPLPQKRNYSLLKFRNGYGVWSTYMFSTAQNKFVPISKK